MVMDPDSGWPTEAETRELVAVASRVLGENGHDDLVAGHASARDPQGRGVWMKSLGRGLTETTADDVVLVDREGLVLAGSGRRHVEFPIHTEIMAMRPDVGAVVHSHPPHAIALAAADESLHAVSHAATFIVPPEIPRFTETANLITNADLGRSVAETLGDHTAAFLVNHGIVTVGADLPTAVVRAIVLERACQQQMLTRNFGAGLVASGDVEALAKRETIWHERTVNLIWEHLVRRLQQRGTMSVGAGALR
jgi:L-fuculose-phosphate aldolase